ncbi:hypothetical protein L9F63_002970, partial [Diploptera punctata]
LNRMHIMEDDCNKPSAASTAIESLPKTNGSSTPCQNSVPALDAEKKIPQENGTGEVEKADQLETSKTLPSEIDEEETEEESSNVTIEKPSSSEVEEPKPPEIAEKEYEASCDEANEAEAGRIPSQSEHLSDKKADNLDEKPPQDDVCSLPPSPDDEDSVASSPESQGVELKRSHKTRQKRVTSDSDSRELDERERIVSEFVDSSPRTDLEELQKHTDKLQQEIHTLSALARAKEHEWNNIIRLKKLKEEMYLRLLRKKQVILLTMGSVSKPNDTLDWDLSSDMSRTNTVDSAIGSLKVTSSKVSSKEHNSASQPATSTGISVLKNNQNQLPLMMVPIVSSATSISSLKVPELGNRDCKSTGRHRPILPKPTTVVVPSGSTSNNNSNNGQNPVIGEGRQGPILDVRSIIADYRSRHPETVPRRGRRLKSSLSPTPNSQQLPDNLVTSTRVSGSGGILSMASLALGSGSQMRTAAARQDISRPSSADSSRSGAQTHTTSEPGGNPGISFKDVLVQFAKMSQTEQRHEPLPTTTASKPPPYPEVTLHPVLAPHSPPHQSPSSSLLHGILTKSNNAVHHRGETSISARPTTFSPTLARLLTAPETSNDLLSTSKTRNEITITPVAAQPVKAKEEVLLVEEEQEDSADRLVIDESGDGDGARSRGENDDDQGSEMAADDVPECQGCHQRAAQFVCAGCGNQWYCSRDCQVSAWDEHSEVCSG